MYRDIPNTITAIHKALREAKVKYKEVFALSGTPAYTADTYSQLLAFYPNFDTQIIKMDAAKGEQLGASLIEDEKMVKARMFISHYIRFYSELVPKVLFGKSKRLVTKEVLTQRVLCNQDQEMSGITRKGSYRAREAYISYDSTTDATKKIKLFYFSPF
ncbi:hypothetical protein ACFLSV_02730 [Bacteroidota bacterium]